MKIEICEHDGFISGKPTLVILLITFPDGKQVRFPYKANRTLAQMFGDVQKLNIIEESRSFNKEHLLKIVDCIQKREDGIIEREDIVRCVKLHEREQGSDNDLAVGNEYRVVNIEKLNGQIVAYEVIDDNADFRMRIKVFPEEIELVRKFVPPAPRKQVFEVTKTCQCGQINALELNGDRYEGKCEKCGKTLYEKRNIKETV